MRQQLERSQQQTLALDFPEEAVLQKAEQIRLSLSYWRRRYRTLEELMADPQRARLLLICARHALRAQHAPRKG